MGAVVEATEGGLTGGCGADGTRAEAGSFRGVLDGCQRDGRMRLGLELFQGGSGRALTRSITHGCVEGCSDNANIKWLIWCLETLDMSEMGEC